MCVGRSSSSVVVTSDVRKVAVAEPKTPDPGVPVKGGHELVEPEGTVHPDFVVLVTIIVVVHVVLGDDVELRLRRPAQVNLQVPEPEVRPGVAAELDRGRHHVVRARVRVASCQVVLVVVVEATVAGKYLLHLVVVIADENVVVFIVFFLLLRFDLVVVLLLIKGRRARHELVRLLDRGVPPLAAARGRGTSRCRAASVSSSGATIVVNVPAAHTTTSAVGFRHGTSNDRKANRWESRQKMFTVCPSVNHYPFLNRASQRRAIAPVEIH
jgi:hypothetical protein